MDPNATLRLILDAITDRDLLEAEYLARQLLRWVGDGGFRPSDDLFGEVMVAADGLRGHSAQRLRSVLLAMK